MAVDLRLPNIKEGTQAEKIEQMQSYMYQLVQQLNWALNAVSTGDNSNNIVLQKGSNGGTDSQTDGKTPIETFNAIKSLIIKSAEIVEAYTDKMTVTFDGYYTAKSDFGSYQEVTEANFEATSKHINQNYSKTELITTNLSGEIGTINGDITNLKTDVGTNAKDIDDTQKNLNVFTQKIESYIHMGSDIGEEERTGIEIGEQREINGQLVFCKFCRLVSDKLSFYDANANEVAYISDQKLYISSAQINTALQIGSYKLDPSNGLAFKWEVTA